MDKRKKWGNKKILSFFSSWQDFTDTFETHIRLIKKLLLIQLNKIFLMEKQDLYLMCFQIKAIFGIMVLFLK